MDSFALAEGNCLLGSESALEFAGAGGRFVARQALSVVLTGGGTTCRVNGDARSWRSVIRLEIGDQLDVAACDDGVYGYLHLVGGVQSPRILASCSTHAPSGLGWHPQVGDMLEPIDPHRVPIPCALPRPDYLDRRCFRIVDGPQSTLFSEQDRRNLVASRFAVSARRNRVGVGLEHDGACFEARSGRRLVSDAIVPGDIQIAADGRATVLLADGQPTGGYPRIATVISADLPALAQTPSHETIAFERISHDAAEAALLEFRSRLARLAAHVNRASLLDHDLISGVVRGDETDPD